MPSPRLGGHVDFVNDYVSEPEDKLTGAMSNAWALYRQHRPLPEGTRIVVYRKNGFMSYERNVPGSTDSLTLQMRYWRCSDGRRLLVGQSAWTIHDGHAVQGQFDGLTLFFYDKVTGEAETVAAEGIGIDPLFGIGILSDGYNTDSKRIYYKRSDGLRVWLSQNECISYRNILRQYMLQTFGLSP